MSIEADTIQQLDLFIRQTIYQLFSKFEAIFQQNISQLLGSHEFYLKQQISSIYQLSCSDIFKIIQEKFDFSKCLIQPQVTQLKCTHCDQYSDSDKLVLLSGKYNHFECLLKQVHKQIPHEQHQSVGVITNIDSSKINVLIFLQMQNFRDEEFKLLNANYYKNYKQLCQQHDKKIRNR